VEEARALLLARALEEGDRTGELTSARERERAGAEARASGGEGADTTRLVARARALVELAAGRERAVKALAAGSTTGAGAVWMAPLALVLGLSTHLLGGRSVNVLAFPLLGALVWNATVYLLLLVAWIRGLARREVGATSSHGLLSGLVSSRLGARVTRLVTGAGARSSGVLTAVGARFADLWLACVRPLLVTRVRVALHVSAAALVAGLVAGMYLRGIAFEYRAQWESTFLGPDAARALLGTLLGPASHLSGIALPDLAAIHGTGEGAGGPAAPWIHLWAITAGLFVVVPRLALAALDAGHAARLSRALPFPMSEVYWRRLRGSGGAEVRVLVVPYGAAPAPRVADRLRVLLHDLLGARAEIVQADALEYGAEGQAIEPPPEPGCLVLLFALAQTPELEVHARLLAELRARTTPGGRLLVVVDGSAYAERLGEGATGRERLAERRRAWDRAAREAGLAVTHIDLAVGLDEQDLERAEAALWTAPGGGGAS